ncbi:hypothetical protein B0A49_04625 [Cryomyces minteri]|uniref:Calcineurin-like phosphoesterase domain-containing protein n=1 Tax=Cryomyces minteri TaxID=331657 RepID=A0A4U0WW39_9PEZI|nr:hypothetical protein B0A49_04625 [Cryomyces minteri]
MAIFSTPASPFDPPSALYTFLTSPLKSTTHALHHLLTSLRHPPPPPHPPIRIVCISDTHTLLPASIPPGDLLIHAGDLTTAGTPAELQAQIDWLRSLPHRHKVVVAGNHDAWLDPRSRATLSAEDQAATVDWTGIHYLQHAATTLAFRSRSPDKTSSATRTLTVYGAPHIPACGPDSFAFQYPRGSDAWTDVLPAGMDVLVTHTPPKHHCDLFPAALGCEWLARETWRVRPRLHVCGHVHAGRGGEGLWWDEGQQAYERAMGREGGGGAGKLLDGWAWVECAKVVYYGVVGLVWNRVWGGDGRPGVLVNASLMYNNSGELRNPPQVVDL